jgi:hypothetical protein
MRGPLARQWSRKECFTPRGCCRLFQKAAALRIMRGQCFLESCRLVLLRRRGTHLQ